MLSTNRTLRISLNLATCPVMNSVISSAANPRNAEAGAHRFMSGPESITVITGGQLNREYNYASADSSGRIPNIYGASYFSRSL